MEVVQKFEMVWPDKEGNDPRGAGKPPRKQQTDNLVQSMMMGEPTKDKTTGERMGFYKKGLNNLQPLNYNPLTAETKVD